MIWLVATVPARLCNSSSSGVHKLQLTILNNITYTLLKLEMASSAVLVGSRWNHGLCNRGKKIKPNSILIPKNLKYTLSFIILVHTIIRNKLLHKSVVVEILLLIENHNTLVSKLNQKFWAICYKSRYNEIQPFDPTKV